MLNHPIARLDRDENLRHRLLPFCRLKPGEIWRDRRNGHPSVASTPPREET